MKSEEQKQDNLIPDLTDPQEARKAFIATEILQRKYN